MYSVYFLDNLSVTEYMVLSVASLCKFLCPFASCISPDLCFCAPVSTLCLIFWSPELFPDLLPLFPSSLCFLLFTGYFFWLFYSRISQKGPSWSFLLTITSTTCDLFSVAVFSLSSFKFFEFVIMFSIYSLISFFLWWSWTFHYVSLFLVAASPPLRSQLFHPATLS